MMLGLIAALATAPWDAPLTLHGIGTLRIGMPVAALRRMGATGEAYPDPDVDCSYWHTARWPGAARVNISRSGSLPNPAAASKAGVSMNSGTNWSRKPGRPP